MSLPPVPGWPGAHQPPAWLPPAWQTVRVRLTAFYGALCLLAGAALLTVTNLLVRRSTGDAVFSAPPGTRLPTAGGQPVRTDQLPVDARQFQAELASLHAHDV